jgi:hypothetical protein
MKSNNILIIIILIFSFPVINSQEGTVVFEEEISWEWPTEDNIYGGYGFYWWHRNEGTLNINFGEMSSTDWTHPEDYYNGEFYLRFEVLDQPTESPFFIQLGVWQDKNKGGAHPETVSSRQYVEGGTGSVFEGSIGSPVNWWNKQENDRVDFSRPEDFYRIGLALWNADPLCIPMGTDWSSSGCPENAEKFFPLRARVRVVAFPAKSKSTSNLSFTVKDEYSNGIQSASITIHSRQLKTNTDGIANIELEYGRYSYTVTKENYRDVSGNISLYDEEVVENIRLERISTINTINTSESQDINIYPNPAERFITVESEHEFSMNTRFDIYGIDGKIILSKTLNHPAHEVTLDMQNFGQGIYLVNILGERQRIVRKIVVR